MNKKILGRYELISMLGRGGMGEVWAAHDHFLDRNIAMKFLTSSGPEDTAPHFEERFRREARYTARLRHSGVPEIHDVGKLPDGRLYLVMELVEGRTLTQILTEHGICPVDQALSIAGQIAAVLAHAHRCGLVHRDLKPSNLMLTTHGKVKVLDFGIAAALAPTAEEPRLTLSGAVFGTPGFISPEQAVGKPATDRSDLYALGCVLYEILTGRPPFTAESPVAVAYLHVNEEPRSVAALRPEMPGESADLVMRLLAKEPESRPSAEATVAALKALVSEADAAARRATVQLPEQTAPEPRSPATSPDERKGAKQAEELRELTSRCDDACRAENYAEAYEGYRNLIDALARLPIPAEKAILHCRASLALCLSKLGREAEAQEEYQTLVPLLLELYGPTHDLVLTPRFNLTVAMAQCGQFAESRESAALLRADLRTHRPGHPAIVLLDDLISRLGRHLLAALRSQQPTT
ncbi:protein kinase [Streptomyces sp. Isolate_45]|uniref:protein kinase domain-containing protein n=1 Tax=Streptomyces sp. Isolate_45 TaxID=2950111 RepID=UPI0024820390|nr:protein kinase [Streptomyces sp. Isolate_45]MDA5282454.1 protein kinase [Streptomyces sp. Isolate_45]